MVNRTKLSSNFTSLPNEMLRSKSLSLTAKGLLVMMLSHTREWVMSLEDIENFGFESREFLRKAAKELEQAGYVTRSNPRDPTTKTFKGTVWTWTDKPVPMSERTSGRRAVKPTDGKPTVGEPATGKPTVANPSMIRKTIHKEDYLKEDLVSKEKNRGDPLGWDLVEADISLSRS